MIISNHHTHCCFCDGEGRPEAYIEESLQRGLTALGFSSHAPTPLSLDWCLPQADLMDYITTIKTLKTRYQDRIKILLGLEVDYIPGVMGPRSPQFQQLGLDYTIGSVHIGGFLEDGTPWEVDGNADLFACGLSEIYGSEIEAAVETYYRLIQRLIREECPTILGHLDLIKKNNSHNLYYREDEDWYREVVEETLGIIAQSGVILELNTGGLTRGRTDAFYPSPWILKRAKELNIQVMVNSDAHRPEQVDAYFKEAYVMLKESGIEPVRGRG